MDLVDESAQEEVVQLEKPTGEIEVQQVEASLE